MRCGCATTTIGGVIGGHTAAPTAAPGAQNRGKTNDNGTLHDSTHNTYDVAPTTRPNKHRLVNHAAMPATLPPAPARFVALEFILRKMRGIVVNAIVAA